MRNGPEQVSPPTAPNIILAGFMGSGKSAVGRVLARRLGWAFADTDDLIQARAGKSIARIFEEDGEPAFRALERQVAVSLAGCRRQVVATGGGMAVDPVNRQALEAAGLLVLLEAQPETIWERVRQATHRPLLQGPDPQGTLRGLYEARRPAYAQIAHRVQTDGRPVDEIANTILELFNAMTENPAIAPCTVTVGLGERAYPIQIGKGWHDGLGRQLATVFPPRPCTLVTNPEIGRLWADRVAQGLRDAGYPIDVCMIPAGERHKTLDTVRIIYDHMLEARHTRQSGLIALGGGVVGDIAGFAAATLLRGIACVQLPTSLLAMVDSSVGGKTGVNHATGKNLIGAFWQPAFVGIELAFLDTLPDEELRAGLAEVIKYGVIADAGLLDVLESRIERALERDAETLAYLVRRSCEIKADVVARDEREGGLRAILNYGHTFGHAAEALSEYSAIRHGEGVAMGMVAAARLAEGRGLIDGALGDRLERLCERAGLPTRMLAYPAEAYWRVMGSDKKVRDGRIRFVLPVAPGRVELFGDVTRTEVEQCLTRCTAQ